MNREHIPEYAGCARCEKFAENSIALFNLASGLEACFPLLATYVKVRILLLFYLPVYVLSSYSDCQC